MRATCRRSGKARLVEPVDQKSLVNARSIWSSGASMSSTSRAIPERRQVARTPNASQLFGGVICWDREERAYQPEGQTESQFHDEVDRRLSC